MQFLHYAFMAMPFAIMLAAALLFCFLAIGAYRSTPTALWLIGFWIIFDIFFPNMPLLRIGLLIYLPDLICVVLAFVTILRLIFERDRPPLYWVWIVFCAAAFASFALGIVKFGSAAGASFRPEFYSIVVASYLMTFRMDSKQFERVMTSLGWICMALMLIVGFRWLVVSIPIPDLLPPGGRFDPMLDASILRVIGADMALLMGQIFVVSLFYASVSKHKSLSWLLVVPLVLAVVGLQHRSVWLAVLVGIAMRYSLPAAGRRGSTQLLVLCGVLMIVILPLLVGGGLGWVAQDVTASAGRALSMTDTAQARLRVWDFGFGKWWEGGVRAWLFGQPLGISLERIEVISAVKKIRVDFQVHNNYLNTLLHYGAVGLAAMLLLYGTVGRRLYLLAKNEAHSARASALILILVIQLAFFMTYSISFVQGLFVGLAAAYTMTSVRDISPTENRKNRSLFENRKMKFRGMRPTF